MFCLELQGQLCLDCVCVKLEGGGVCVCVRESASESNAMFFAPFCFIAGPTVHRLCVRGGVRVWVGVSAYVCLRESNSERHYVLIARLAIA